MRPRRVVTMLRGVFGSPGQRRAASAAEFSTN
jgi:hypothetical protein